MRPPDWIKAGLIFGLAAFPITLTAGDPQPSHRADFEMNFIGGGEFRQYIMDHVVGDDLWAASMRAFGTAHNLMHELMSDLARHDASARGNPERVPDFATRISGGQWTRYREALEAESDTSAWAQLIQATEVMHDRFHQAMYHATVLDKTMNGRSAVVRDYLRSDPLPEATVFPEPLLPEVALTTTSAFLHTVWTAPPETPDWHAAYQQTAVFTEMLSTLMTEWAYAANERLPETARPPVFTGRMDQATWLSWIAQFPDDGDPHWRHFLQSVALMHHHIHEMLYWMEHYTTTRLHSGKAPVCCEG